MGSRDEVGRASGGHLHKGPRSHLKQLDSSVKVMGRHCVIFGHAGLRGGSTGSLVMVWALVCVASVSAVHRLSRDPHGMWDLSSQPGIEPMSPTLEGRFLTTGPPGSSHSGVLGRG